MLSFNKTLLPAKKVIKSHRRKTWIPIPKGHHSFLFNAWTDHSLCVNIMMWNIYNWKYYFDRFKYVYICLYKPIVKLLHMILNIIKRYILFFPNFPISCLFTCISSPKTYLVESTIKNWNHIEMIDSCTGKPCLHKHRIITYNFTFYTNMQIFYCNINADKNYLKKK